MMTVDQMIEVLTAYKAGKKIQFLSSYHGEWIDWAGNTPSWDFPNHDYRVKPEPKVIWVNEYKDGSHTVHSSREDACRLTYDGYYNYIAARYVESPEE